MLHRGKMLMRGSTLGCFLVGVPTKKKQPKKQKEPPCISILPSQNTLKASTPRFFISLPVHTLQLCLQPINL